MRSADDVHPCLGLHRVFHLMLHPRFYGAVASRVALLSSLTNGLPHLLSGVVLPKRGRGGKGSLGKGLRHKAHLTLFLLVAVRSRRVRDT